MGILSINLKPFLAAALAATLFFSPAGAQEAGLDDLYSQLQQAEGEEAKRIAKAIEREWNKSGSATADFLLRRGRDAMEVGEFQVAIEHLTALTDHAPDFAQGYALRASAFYRIEMFGPALEDLRRALELDPRHFEAMAGLGAIFEALSRHQEAYDAYARVKAIHPSYREVTEALNRLEPLAKGRAL